MPAEQISVSSDDQLLTTAQLSAMIGISTISLAQWRARARGPAFVRLPGARAVRYRKSDVIAWLAAGTVGKAVTP